MQVKEVEEVLAKKGCTLVKIVPFKKSDRIRWKTKDLKVSLNLGKKIENMTVEEFDQWVV